MDSVHQGRNELIRSATAILAVAAGLCLAGCETPYGSTGLTGGHEDKKLNERLVKVNFYGNGYITSDKVQRYALYRCAEVARNANKPHFVIYESLAAASLDVTAELPRVGTLGNKPVAVAFLLLEDQPRSGSQETSKVLERLGPLVRGPQGTQGTGGKQP